MKTGHLNIGDFYLGLIRNGTRMARLRRTTFVLFVGGILAYGAAFAGYMLDRFDLVDLLEANTDDAFYYFQVASRMAAGEFSTFDGITRTNGYHPLWLFLITPFYWVLDKTAALFAIKSFEIMLVAGGVALAAGAARVARLPWVLFVCRASGHLSDSRDINGGHRRRRPRRHGPPRPPLAEL